MTVSRSPLLDISLLFPSVDDTHEVSCLQRSAADKATINVRFSEQFRSVACLAAATVKDSGVVSNSLSVFLSDDATDVSMYFLCLVCRCGLACSDSPNWLISNYYILEFFLCEVENAALKLGLNDLVLLASLPFFKALADTEDYLQAILQREKYFLLQYLGSLCVVTTALRVAFPCRHSSLRQVR